MFGVLAVMSMIWDFRMHSAVCMAIAGVLWIKASPGSGGVISGRRFLQLGVAALVVMGAVYGLLKWTESDFHKQRRGSSSFGREIGLKTGVRAIMNSPFVGYGSWGRNPQIAAIEIAVANEDPENMKRYGANFKPNGTSLAPHSQFLQAWMEGGILGAAFFLVLGARLLRHARFLILRRKQDALAAILYFTVFYGLWNLINSPFSAPHRVNIALAACAAVVLSVEAAAASRQNGGGRIFRSLATLPLRPQLTANQTAKRRHP
jgi:O-antigen ligase